MFVAFDHTLRGRGVGRLWARNPAPRRAASVVLRGIRDDRLPLWVSSGWVLLPPTIAVLLSPLSFDLEWRGTVLGTPAYMAPEQVLGEAVGPASDLYAWGSSSTNC